jgi:elongation factor P
MNINPNDITIGSVFRREGRVLRVTDKQHVKLSKGGACQQVKCTDLESGSNIEMRLNVNESLESVFVEKRTLTYSYTEGDTAIFMNDDFETVDVKISDLNEVGVLFSGDIKIDPMPKIEIEYFKDNNGNDKIVNARLLDDFAVEIDDTRPSIKGEAAKSGYKPATTQGGIKIKVPPHVNVGDMVILSKVDLSYIGKK